MPQTHPSGKLVVVSFSPLRLRLPQDGTLPAGKSFSLAPEIEYA
jgi:hypothetical protein